MGRGTDWIKQRVPVRLLVLIGQPKCSAVCPVPQSCAVHRPEDHRGLLASSMALGPMRELASREQSGER